MNILIKKAFSFIPFLEIWTISNHIGMAIQTFMLAICIIHYIDGLAWGVVLSCVMGLSRTSKNR